MNDLKVRLKAEIMSYFDECEVSIFAVAGANYYETLGRCIKGFCVLSNILDVFNRSSMRKTDVFVINIAFVLVGSCFAQLMGVQI